MRNEYRKLVRDRIPEIIQNDGQACAVVILTKDEYRNALREKLVEEAREAADANVDDVVTELADLYEVIEALMNSYAIDPETVRAAQEKRRTDRGGFGGRVCLLWAE